MHCPTGALETLLEDEEDTGGGGGDEDEDGDEEMEDALAAQGHSIKNLKFTSSAPPSGPTEIEMS